MPTIRSTSDAFLQLWGQAIVFLHNIVGAAVWLLVGYIVARLVKAVLVKALHAIRFDRVVDRAGVEHALQAAGTRMDAADVLGTVVFWWIFLMFVENAVTALGISTLTAFINAILGYIPNVFAAILILIVGALIANVVAGIVRGAATEAGLTTAGLLANVARWGILLFAALSALTQLNVAQNMIFILFAGLVTMLAIAGGLAFGLGGVDSARSLLAGQAMSSMLQPGQQVQIGNQTGRVVRHDMNTTVLETGSGLTSIPNAALAKEQVTVLNGGGQR